METVSVLSKKLAETLKREVEEVEKKRIKLREIRFIDMYNGRPWTYYYVYGMKIEDKELCETIARMLDIIHDDCCHSVEFIAITKNGVYVQYVVPRYNQYGSWVGDDEGYEKLNTIIEMFREKVAEIPEKRELLEKLKSLLEETSKEISAKVEAV